MSDPFAMKRKKYLFILLCLLISAAPLYYISRCKSALPLLDTAGEKGKEVDSLKLVFVGDVMVHSPQIRGALMDGEGREYHFSSAFQYMKHYISSADLALANLETTFGGQPYRGYPMFSSPHELAGALKECGFDVLLTANNHILDSGKKGMEKTVDLINEAGLHYTGVFRDAAERKNNYPLPVEVNGFKLAILNYTYGTNGLTLSKPGIVNYIDTLQIRADLDKAKKMNPDYIISCVHWGEEYQRKENREQRQIAHFLAEYGSDLIVGSHPHVVQPFSNIPTTRGDTVPVLYSLGNFISNQRDRYCDGGIAFEVTLTKTNDTVSLASLAYEPFWVKRTPKGGASRYRLIPINAYAKTPSAYRLTPDQKKHLTRFQEDTKKTLHNLKCSAYPW
jgi:poly-gamma-glutamate synthesis protein (capsule biosynthesis protein)